MQVICVCCNSKFISYGKQAKYCSLDCKWSFNTRNIDFEKAKSLYESGMSQKEIGNTFGVSQKVIYKFFMRHNYKCRVAAKRDQKGIKNTMWKGNSVSYSAFHFRVESIYGKPKKCSVCGTDDLSKSYDWANLTGKYEDVSDYKRMCRSCHRQYDKNRPNSSKMSTNALCK